MNKNFLGVVLALPILLFGKLVETDSVKTVIDHLSPGSLVIFDLDNTLIEPIQQLGSVQWGEAHVKRLVDSGMSHEKAEEMTHKKSLTMLPTIKLRLIEEASPEIIKSIQEKGIVVLGLTTRWPEEAKFVHPELRRLRISFDHPFLNHAIAFGVPALYENGVIFCSTRNKKGEILVHFLKEHNVKPKKIIFIDDKFHHIQSVEQALAPLHIEYVGIRYSGSDQRVKEFDSRVTDFQWEHFPPFITDEEATSVLKE